MAQRKGTYVASKACLAAIGGEANFFEDSRRDSLIRVFCCSVIVAILFSRLALVAGRSSVTAVVSRR